MRKSILSRAIIGVAAVVSVGVVGGARGALVNTGFEDITVADGRLTATANPLSNPQVDVVPDPAPGWICDTPFCGTMNPTDSYMPGEALGGQNVGWSSGGLLYQAMTDDIQPSTTYTLTVNVGRPTVATDFAYRIILESGGLVKLQDLSSVPIGIGQWEQVTLTWDSPATVPAGSKLTVNLAADKGVALFDDVGLTGGSTTGGGPDFPEPTAAAALIAPVVAGMVRRRR